MSLYCLLGLSMAPYGSLWLSMVAHGIRLFHMAPFGDFRSHGSLCLPLVPYGSPLPPKTPISAYAADPQQ